VNHARRPSLLDQTLQQQEFCLLFIARTALLYGRICYPVSQVPNVLFATSW
jgi:hypothetical protein